MSRPIAPGESEYSSVPPGRAESPLGSVVICLLQTEEGKNHLEVLSPGLRDTILTDG